MILSKKYLSLMLACGLSALVGCDKTPAPKADAPTTASTQSSASTTAVTTTTVTNTNEYGKNLPANAPTYNVATISSFTPFIFRDENGHTIGFDVDILKAIGEKQGFKVNYLVVPWEGIFNTVSKGTHDIISSAVVITPERQALVDFSHSYIESGRMAVVKKDSPLNTIEDLKNKKIATQAGTSNIPLVEQIVSDKALIDKVNTQFLEIQEVMLGKADAAFDDSRVLQYYLAKNPQLKAIPYPNYKGDNFGFAVKKGNTQLLDKINTGLDQIKQDGTYDKIYKKWFGDLPSAVPSGSNSATTMTTVSTASSTK